MASLGGLIGGLGGGAIGQASVKLLLETTQYQGQLAAAEGETKAATGQMEASTAASSGAMTGLYVAAGAAAVAFGAAAVESASEHEQVMAALTAAVGTNTQAFEEQATALQNLSGFQDEAILSADTLLSRFNLTDQQVRDAIPTILDYARATGKTVPDSAQLIGKALLGNARALKTVGINYTATGNTAEDYATILDELNSKVGGQAAAYAETYAGKLEILSARFDDVKEAIGGELIESLTEFADDLTIILALGEKIGSALPDQFGGVAKVIEDTLNPVHFLSEGLGFLDKTFHLTEESGAELTDSLTRTASGVVILDEAATHVDPKLTAMQESISGLADATETAGEGILTLSGTVKETFDLSQHEMDKGFQEMLRSAVRFQRDMAVLENLKVGLSPKDTVAFEQFLIDEGPGAVDRFVRSSKGKQDEWVAQWERSSDAVKKSIRSIGDTPVTIRVNTSALDVAQAKADHFRDALARLGGI